MDDKTRDELIEIFSIERIVRGAGVAGAERFSLNSLHNYYKRKLIASAIEKKYDRKGIAGKFLRCVRTIERARKKSLFDSTKNPRYKTKRHK